MSGVQWVRFDTTFFDHPKALALLDEGDAGCRAITLWMFGLTYSGRHGLDGFVPQRALRLVDATRADAELLVRVGLWRADGTSGWLIHAWAERQATDAEAKARSEKARRAANARWHPPSRHPEAGSSDA